MVTVTFPMKEWTTQVKFSADMQPYGKQPECEIRMKGNTVIEITKGLDQINYPINKHARYKANKAPMKKVERFASPERFIWW